MAQVYLQKKNGGRIRLVEETRVKYWESQGFVVMKDMQKKKTTPKKVVKKTE
jgi:hypothetical protein